MKIPIKTALQLLSFCLQPSELEATKRNFYESAKGEEFFLVDPDVGVEFYRPLTSIGYRSDGVMLASNGDCLIVARLENSESHIKNVGSPFFYASIDRKTFTELVLTTFEQSIESLDLSNLLNSNVLRLLPEDNIFARLDLTEDMRSILEEGKRSGETISLRSGYLQDISTLTASLGKVTDLTIFKNSEGLPRAVLFSVDSNLLGLVATIKRG